MKTRCDSNSGGPSFIPCGKTAIQWISFPEFSEIRSYCEDHKEEYNSRIKHIFLSYEEVLVYDIIDQ